MLQLGNPVINKNIITLLLDRYSYSRNYYVGQQMFSKLNVNEGWMNANEEKNKELKTPSSLASNVLYNETEYFAFPNIWLIILFVYVVVYPVTINTTSLFLNTIKLNDNWMELISTSFSTIFLLIIISPALLILLESDITILPSFLIQSPAYQWARTFNIVGVGADVAGECVSC